MIANNLGSVVFRYTLNLNSMAWVFMKRFHPVIICHKIKWSQIASCKNFVDWPKK